MEIEEYYQQGRYQQKISSARKKYLRHLINLLRVDLDNLAPKTVLDAGCGDGLLTEMLKDVTGAKVYGTDISKKGLEITKKRGILVKQGDLNKSLAFDDETFDLVISNQVIEHLLEPDHFLKECGRVLRPEGYLILTTPNLAAWYNRLLFLFGVYPIFLEASTDNKLAGTKFLRRVAVSRQGVGHLKVLNLAALSDLLNINNFKIEKTIGLTRNFHLGWPASFIYRFLDKIFSFWPGLSSDLLVIAEKK